MIDKSTCTPKGWRVVREERVTDHSREVEDGNYNKKIRRKGWGVLHEE